MKEGKVGIRLFYNFKIYQGISMFLSMIIA